MKIKRPNRVKVFFKLPEVQFFIIFIILFFGAFVINYIFLPDKLKVVGVIVFISATIIVLLESIYSAYFHDKLNKEEHSFMSVTAHQMRTPLTAIRWSLNELKNPNVNKEDVDEYIKMMQISSEKLENIINDFNDMAQIEGGSRLDYVFEDVEINTFISKAIKEALPVAKQFGVRIELEIPKEEFLVRCDEKKLSIVLNNLINNAIKYSNKSGVVTIRLRKLTSINSIEVSVEDSGVGISPEDQKMLFTKFFRSKEAKSINPTGSGLGLFIVKNIISEHGGKVTVQSIIGKGSTFNFTIPIKNH